MFKERIQHCPLCESIAIGHKYNINRYKVKFDVDQCSECGFIFMNPLFTDDVIKQFYSEDYFKGKADYSYIDEREIIKYSRYVWNRRIKVIHSYVKDGNFLDIGCSFAGLLESASKYYTPFGIELSGYAFRHAHQLFGDNIHHGTLENHTFSNEFFSAITMIELIEHIADPVFAINQCFKLLRPGGVLVIQTANMNGRQAKVLRENYEYFMPGHLSYFTAENLTMMLQSAGFGKVRVYYPVEFGLIPKLLKSRGSFRKFSDYAAWLRISYYHMKSKIHFRNFAMTSSMVIYAIKDQD